MEKQNIAIIVNRMTGAGPARVASNLTLYLPNEFYNKTVIIFDAENSTYNLDGNVINLNIKGKKTILGKIYNTIKRIVKIRKIKRENNISTTISLLPNPNLVNILSKVDDKIIVSERSFMSKHFKGLLGKIYKLIYKTLYNKAYLVVAVSKVVKEDLISNFGIHRNKVKVIYNFYDVEKIALLANDPLLEKEEELFEKPTVITVGRLDDAKGQWHLIRAFSKIKEEVTDAKLIVLGEDTGLKEYFETLSKELNILKDVHFLGFKKNPFKYLSKAGIFVFPSLFEGFPNGLSEAMACGLPVISSDCQSGPREILSPSMSIELPTVEDVTYAEYGILVPTCDGNKYAAEIDLTTEENILAKAVIEVFKNKEMRKKYSMLSKERVRHFHKNNIIKEWENIIND